MVNETHVKNAQILRFLKKFDKWETTSYSGLFGKWTSEIKFEENREKNMSQCPSPNILFVFIEREIFMTLLA